MLHRHSCIGLEVTSGIDRLNRRRLHQHLMSILGILGRIMILVLITVLTAKLLHQRPGAVELSQFETSFILTGEEHQHITPKYAKHKSNKTASTIQERRCFI